MLIRLNFTVTVCFQPFLAKNGQKWVNFEIQDRNMPILRPSFISPKIWKSNLENLIKMWYSWQKPVCLCLLLLLLLLGHLGGFFGYTVLPPLRYSLQFTLTWNPLCIEWLIKIWSHNFKPFWSYVNLLLVRGGLLQYVEAWQVTAWKFSKYIVFSGPCFPAFSQNAGKCGSEKTLYLDTFRAVGVWGQEKQNILIFKWLANFILKKVAYCFILGHNAWS